MRGPAQSHWTDQDFFGRSPSISPGFFRAEDERASGRFVGRLMLICPLRAQLRGLPNLRGRVLCSRPLLGKAVAIAEAAGFDRSNQFLTFGGLLPNESPSSTSRRIASERDGESFSCPHRLTASIRLAGIRTP